MSFEFLTIIQSKKIATNPIKFLRDIETILKKYTSNNQKLTVQMCYFLAYYFYHLFTAEHYSETYRLRIQSIMYIFSQVNNKTLGTYMNFLMSEKYVQSLRELPNYRLKQKLSFDILQLLKCWIPQFELISGSIKNNKKIDTFGVITEFLRRKNQFTLIEDKILIINYIYSDILTILPSFIMNNNEKIPSSQICHIDSLIKFLSLILPRTMFRINIELISFPNKFINYQGLNQSTDNLIYIIEHLESQIICCEFYTILIKTLLKSLIDHLDELSDQQQQKVVDFVFRFYYVYHMKSMKQAQEFIIQCFSNLSNIIKFAISQQLIQFLQIVKQLNHEYFLNRIIDDFPWIKQIKSKFKVSVSPKDLVDPFPDSSIQLTIIRGTKQIRYLQIYRDFSLVYFDINCKNADISVKFIYAGNFYDKVQTNSILLEKQKLKVGEIYRGSIQVSNPGLYYFEFDNTYSWMTHKNIQLRYSVLASINIQYINYNREYMKLYFSQIRGYKEKILKMKGERKISMQLCQNQEQAIMKQSDQQNVCEMDFNPPLYYIKILNKKTNHKFQYQLQTNNLQSASLKISNKLTQYMNKNKIEDMNSLIKSQYQKVRGPSLVQFIRKNIQKQTDHKDKLQSKTQNQSQIKAHSQLDQNRKQKVQNDTHKRSPIILADIKNNDSIQS